MPQATDQLPSKRVELILQQLEELPTLPAVVVRLLEATGSDDASTAEVVRLISADPALTARILQLVHRSDVGVGGEINSVDRAVVLLGFEAVRSAVLAVSVFHTFGPDQQPLVGCFNREEFWKHSVAVACCAELLAGQRPGEVNPSEAFVCGLLHDLGKVALDAILPKSFSRVVEAADLLRGNIADLERTVIGLDHMVVGKRLAERWQLPASIRECIWLHGQLPQALPATVKNPRLVNIVTLADLLVREQHLGYSGNYTFSVSRRVLCDAIGLNGEQIERILQQLVQHVEPRAKALGLGQASSMELYQQALAQANKELGRVSSQLVSKNRRLTVRAKFFDALSGFQAELRPDAPPQTVLQAIAQTAVGVLDVASAAAFSIAPAQPFADVMLVDSSGDVAQATVVDCPQRPGKPPGGIGPVLAAGDELDWLLAAISPRLVGERRFWVCLEADGLCIGGVVWGGQSGESQRLGPQVQELFAIAAGWSLALRTSQIREESRLLAEQLAEANRQLQNAQAEILRSRTLLSVGEMAAGAGHEMNNPLAVISGRSQLLAGSLSDPKLKSAAEQIVQQSHRLSEIISELMDFAKPAAPKPAECELAAIVQAAIQQAKGQVDPADRVFDLTMGDVPPVKVDVQQLTDALAELIDNAIQATDPATGRIELNAAFDPYSVRVVLSISDNGCGMDSNTLKRAFDPFFSHKRAGRRRGLGLAKALRWVESNGGSIRLESHPNQGTRALVLLPAVPLEEPGQAIAVGRRAAQ